MRPARFFGAVSAVLLALALAGALMLASGVDDHAGLPSLIAALSGAGFLGVAWVESAAA